MDVTFPRCFWPAGCRRLIPIPAWTPVSRRQQCRLPQSTYRWPLWSSAISKLRFHPVLWESVSEPPLRPQEEAASDPAWGRSSESDMGSAFAQEDADKSSWVSSWARAYVPRVTMNRGRSLPDPAGSRLCLASLGSCSTWFLPVTPAQGAGTHSDLR